MNFFYQITTMLSAQMRPHISQIVIGFIATLLVVFGNDISGLVARLIKNLSFIFRLVILVAVCAVGYTIMTNMMNQFATDFLRSLSNRWLSVAVVAAFIAVGIVAERKKYM